MPHDLDALLSPRSLVVFGASDKATSVGGRVLANILAGGYEGEVHAVNPKRDEVAGRPCHRSLADVESRVDLAVIATPAANVPGILAACGEHGIRAAVVLSAGFAEVGPRGERLLEDVLRTARDHDMRLLGPNCLGFATPHVRLNATFSRTGVRAGSLALVSQSGALCTAILDWAEQRRVGFSSVISLGEAADVGFGEILDHLALDPRTESILLHVEGIRRPRSFMSGLRAAARMKPVVVLKAGRHAEGARAAASHTGALVGGDDAFDAAIRRAGAVRVATIEQLFAAAELLAKHRRVQGNGLAIITNAGGLGVLAADRAVDLSLRLSDLGEGTLARLNDALPAAWSHGNPVDVLGDAPPERYQAAVTACLEDESVHGVLVMLTPQAMTEPLEVARLVAVAARSGDKPVLTCWMGGGQVESARKHFAAEKVPTFMSPEASVEAFSYLASHRTNQALLLQTPGPLSDRTPPDVEGARLIIEGVLDEGRTVLTKTESKALLAAFRIPAVQSIEATTANQALVAAQSLGLPVALKILSPDLSHVSDVGGIRLNIGSPHDVRRAFTDLVTTTQARCPEADIRGVTVEPMVRRAHGREVLLGIARDEALGPVIVFGAGGTAVELLGDRAVALPPLNAFLAEQLIARTRAARLLGEFRGQPPVNLAAVTSALQRLSEVACELPHVRELDINPLLVDEDGVIALDCRVVVAQPATELAPYGHVAIHPYPTGLDRRIQLADGREVVLRPIRPEDARIEASFVRNLSEQSRYFRFMHALKELTPQMLVRFTQIDYDREMAFIAVTESADAPDGEEQIGVARYATNPDGRTCEFALSVADAWHGRGIGTRLMQRLMEVARERGLATMVGEVLAENTAMLHLVQKLGFRARTSTEDAKIQNVTKSL